jgi:hypothetical protein
LIEIFWPENQNLAQSAACDLTKFRSRLLALFADFSKQFPTIFPSKSLFFECGGPRPKTPTFDFRRNRDSIKFA